MGGDKAERRSQYQRVSGKKVSFCINFQGRERQGTADKGKARRGKRNKSLGAPIKGHLRGSEV